MFEYEVTEEQDVTTGSIWRRLLRRAVHFLHTNKTVNYDLKVEGASVCIVALTPDNHVLLVEQYRGGPCKRLKELPGGGVDPGKNETLEQAAARELLEETGYEGDLEYVARTFVCAYSTGVRHVFVARNCVQVKHEIGEGIERGDLELVRLTLDEFLRHLRSGELTDVEAGFLGLCQINYLRPTAL